MRTLGLVVLLLAATSGLPPAVAQAGERVPWTTSQIRGTPEPPLPYVIERVYRQIELDHPTDVIPVPGTQRLIVTQLAKPVVSFDRQHPEAGLKTALDMTEVPEWSQTFGIVFHPQYPQVPWCYLTYQLKEQGPAGTRLARFEVTDPKLPVIDPKSELLMATWRNQGHRGGCLQFGPDGYLYVSIGDGTVPSPPDGLMTGQDISDLQSSILRLDVNGATRDRPYRIPADNPFTKLKGARGEVWAYGLRNPWKFCFDPKTGDLWAGDVGWELMEMVYRVQKGGNYGWSVMEGSQPVHPDAVRGPTPIQPPVVEHTHVEARSVTGGYFYYGDRLPQLDGVYLYGDYMTGKIWGLKYDGQQVTWHEELADTRLQIISFAREPSGEILVVGFDGTLHRLIPNPSTQQNTKFPRKLSETGLFASTPELKPAPGVVPYTINAEHWADYTQSERLLAVPGETRIGLFTKDKWETGEVTGNYDFPAETVLAKTISLEMEAGRPETRRRLETQILHRNGDAWRAYNYVWNDEQTDAVLQENTGVDRVFQIKDATAPGGVRRQVWHHSSRDECLLCHIWRSGTVHGFKLDQLNRQADSGSQLERLYGRGFFNHALPKDVEQQVSPYDESQNLEQRARAWLQLNCAHCHQNGAGGTATFDVRQQLTLEETKLLASQVTQGAFGIQQPQVIAPGHPERSVLYYRLSTLGRGHMPKFGSNLLDPAGLKLIRDWIGSLPITDPKPDPQAERYARLLSALKASRDVDASVGQLLATTNGALQLATALYEGSLPEKVAEQVIQRGAHHTDVQIRDVFEQFLPASQRTPRLGSSFDVAALLERKGNADHGRELFLAASGVTCRKCHTIDRQGGKVGPDLSDIGRKLRPDEILDNIVRPSKKLDPKYANWIVETDRGTVHTGLKIRETDREVVLRDANAKDTVLARSEIDVMQPQQKSIMPEQLLRDFTAEHAADLLAYLATRKGDPRLHRKTHKIPRTTQPLEIDGKLDEQAWKSAPPVGAFEFTWWNEGDGAKQPTEAKLLWDDKYLYVAFHCLDTDIRATRTERDGEVYRDDCVEVFASPFVDDPARYFNLEINATGVRLDNFRPNGTKPEAPWNPDGIRIATTRDGTLNDDQADKSWTVEVAFPYSALGKSLSRPPRAGDRWRLNLHRLEGDMRIKSQWSPGDRNRASLHVPEYFGEVIFANSAE